MVNCEIIDCIPAVTRCDFSWPKIRLPVPLTPEIER